MEARLTYGIRDGILHNIKDVESGLSCNLNCALCDDRLIAKKGNRKQHHFAHYRVENCKGAVETSLHLLAKEIISEKKEITLPRVELKIGTKQEHFIFHKPTKVKFNKIRVENKLGEIIPDLICYVNQQPLLVEIAVTHFIDEIKKQKIKKLNLSTIEVDLSEFKEGITKEELSKLLIDDTSKKKWIFNRKLNFIHNSVMQEKRKLVDKYDFDGTIITRRWHMNCPISKNGFASYFDDCSDCIYNNEVYTDHYLGGELSVFCSAKNRMNIDNKIREMGGMPISNNI